MLSSSDLTACSACGSREVKTVHRTPERSVIERLADDIEAGETKLQTFYACAGCGRDVTDAWVAIQPAKLTDEEIGGTIEALHQVVVVDKVLDEDEGAHSLGIGATVNNGGES